MTLKGPTQEDVRKLHHEVNQLLHERILVSLGAISMFGVLVAWQLQAAPRQSGHPLGSFVVILSIISVLLLFVLFLFQFLLRGSAKILSTYLIITGSSGWELDWQRYRDRRGYWGYSKPITILFFILSTISASFPCFLAWALGLKWEPQIPFWVLLGVWFLTSLLFFGFASGKLADREPKAKDRWAALMGSH